MDKPHIIIAWIFLLTACTVAQPEPTATLPPTNTPVAPSATFTPTIKPTQTITSSPSSTYTPISTNTPTAIPRHPKGSIVRHDIYESVGFEYFSYLPSNFPKDEMIYIVVNATYGQCVECCTQEDSANNAEYYLQFFQQYADKHKFALLFPAFPNNCDGFSDPWVLHFDDYVFVESTDSIFFRPDLKTNEYIDDLIKLLRSDGYTVADKVFVFGFSIGGHFANRYPLLQPDRVQAFAVGAVSGEISIPAESVDGFELKWFLGVSNYEEIVGKPFDQEEFIQIPQLYFWGDQDLEHYHLEEKCLLSPTSLNYCYWRNYWGSDLVTALRNQCSYLGDIGLNVECKEYPGLDHDFYEEMRWDVFEFFDKYRQ